MVRQLGMTPLQALHAATENGAALLGVDAGVLAPGRPADLLVLARDVTGDVRALRDPQVVVKAGAIVHERG
jgi:imidazolonepropionase-like amidohydrolase